MWFTAHSCAAERHQLAGQTAARYAARTFTGATGDATPARASCVNQQLPLLRRGRSIWRITRGRGYGAPWRRTSWPLCRAKPVPPVAVVRRLEASLAAHSATPCVERRAVFADAHRMHCHEPEPLRLWSTPDPEENMLTRHRSAMRWAVLLGALMGSACV